MYYHSQANNDAKGPFYQNGLTLIPACVGNYIQYKVWDEISYPSPNIDGFIVEGWELISNFIPHFTVRVVTYPCWDEN